MTKPKAKTKSTKTGGKKPAPAKPATKAAPKTTTPPKGSRNPPKPIVDRKEVGRAVKKLPCAIDPSMLALRGDDLAKACNRLLDLKESRRNENAEHRDRKSRIEEEIAELALNVEKHEETRDVECVDYLLKGGIVETVRQDTQETVSTRAATGEELQERIFDKIEGAKAGGPVVLTPESGRALKADKAKRVEPDSALLGAVFDEEIKAADAKNAETEATAVHDTDWTEGANPAPAGAH